MERSAMIVALLAASPVFAQEANLSLPPPAPVPVERIQALEESAHHKKTAGTVLQAAGGAVAFTGVLLIVAASWSDEGACARNDTWAVESYTTGSPSRPASSCGDNTLSIAGGITLVLGVAMILPGVAVMQSGNGDLAQAQQLRRSHGIEWSVRPSVGPHGARAELAMRF